MTEGNWWQMWSGLVLGRLVAKRSVRGHLQCLRVRWLSPDLMFCLGIVLKNKFIYLVFAALGLCFCAQAFSSCGEQGLLFVVVRRLLIVVASLVVEHGL